MSGGLWVQIGSIAAGLAVAAGAFGAHGLRGQVESRRLDPRMFEIFETAAQYQMYHALALVAVGLLALSLGRSVALAVSGWAFLVGLVLFSGSLYALVFTGQRWLGAITPIGGVAFLVGWVALAVAAAGRVAGASGDMAGP